MQFKDAAYEILKETAKAVHYKEITQTALARKKLKTDGKTPEATMGALLYIDTLNEDSRFQREGRGRFALRSHSITGIEHQIKAAELTARQELRAHLLQMDPQKFEELIRALLEVMGFEETETTPYVHDKGVDVRGILRKNQLTPVRVAIQAKRWKGKNVGAEDVRKLRGSLSSTGEHGIMITSKDFTSDAKDDAQSTNRIPITLINGNRLVDLLFEYRRGIREEQHTIRSIDTEYWSEAFGVSFDKAPQVSVKKITKGKIKFPLAIQAQHNTEIFHAELLDLEKGAIRFRDTDYATPTTAAKIIVTNWKEVNGWGFWRFQNPQTEVWGKIKKLR